MSRVSRRAGGDRTGPDPVERWRAWTTSVAITAAIAALIGAFFWWWPHFWGTTLHGGMFGDLSQLTTASRLILHGRFHDVYGDDAGFLGLPLAALIMVPVDLLGVHGRADVLVAGVWEVLLASTVLQAARKLAWEVHASRHLLAVQVVAAVLVVFPEVEYAHAEDVLALALTLHALRRLIRGDPMRAALFLSAAISFKQWAVVLVPFVVLRAGGARSQAAAAVRALALPAALGVAALLLDGSGAARAFFHPLPSNPLSGHPGFAYTWLGLHGSEASRTVALVLAVALCWLLRRATSPAAVLAAAALVIGIRPLGETVNYSYYWTPAAAVALLACVTARRRLSAGDVGWLLAAIVWSFPRGLDMSDSGWWVCETIILAMCACRVRLALRADVRGHRGENPVDEPAGLVRRVGAGQLHSF